MTTTKSYNYALRVWGDNGGYLMRFFDDGRREDLYRKDFSGHVVENKNPHYYTDEDSVGAVYVIDDDPYYPEIAVKVGKKINWYKIDAINITIQRGELSDSEIDCLQEYVSVQ